MRVLRLWLGLLFLSLPVRAQDLGIKWDSLPPNDPATSDLQRAVKRSYFKLLDKAHVPSPQLLVVHCYTAGMTPESTRVVIGRVQDEVWLAGDDVHQLEHELTIMVFLRKQLQKE